MRAPILASVLLLAACQPNEEAPSAQAPVNADPQVRLYACEDGQQVEAGYPDAESAVINVKGRPYPLKIARSASGARYVGYGLQWWTRGDEATLSTLKPGEDVASDPGVTCRAG